KRVWDGKGQQRIGSQEQCLRYPRQGERQRVSQGAPTNQEAGKAGCFRARSSGGASRSPRSGKRSWTATSSAGRTRSALAAPAMASGPPLCRGNGQRVWRAAHWRRRRLLAARMLAGGLASPAKALASALARLRDVWEGWDARDARDARDA